MSPNIQVEPAKLGAFCKKWKVTVVEFFGSVLRDDWRPDSDVDVLISFAPDADPSLLDHVAMQEELSGIFGRKVDLLTHRSVERSHNWIRRDSILGSARRVYEVG